MFQAIGLQNLSLKEKVNNKLNCDIEKIFVNNSWINESPYIDVDSYKICGIKQILIH